MLCRLPALPLWEVSIVIQPRVCWWQGRRKVGVMREPSEAQVTAARDAIRAVHSCAASDRDVEAIAEAALRAALAVTPDQPVSSERTRLMPDQPEVSQETPTTDLREAIKQRLDDAYHECLDAAGGETSVGALVAVLTTAVVPFIEQREARVLVAAAERIKALQRFDHVPQHMGLDGGCVSRDAALAAVRGPEDE